METAQRQLCAKLLRAGKPVSEIVASLGTSRSYVFKIKKLLQQGKDLTVVRSGGPKQKKRTGRKINAVAASIQADPKQSIRGLARRHKMSEPTMRRLVKEDLGLQSRAVQLRPLLTPATMEKRAERAHNILARIRHQDAGKIRIFSDEKIFTADAAVNRRNSRYLSGLPVGDVDPKIRITPFHKAPAKVMVLGVVGSDGQKCPIIFVDAGEKVNADVYCRLLAKHVVPWLQKTYPNGNYVFQQDGAPAHTARSTQRFLEENMASYWPPTVWPPYSPDLNPLDYSIWGVLQTKVQATAHDDVKALKQSIRRQWRAMSADYIQRTCAAFRHRLERVTAANGAYIE